MLTEQDRVVLKLLNQNLDQSQLTLPAIEQLLVANDNLLKQLPNLVGVDLALDDQLLIQNISNKFQWLIANLDGQRREAQMQIMTMKSKKSTLASYMQYNPQSTFVNRDL